MENNINSQRMYDIAIIGGGINGVGVAADAAARGLSVFLCEKDDLASHTSSASSKLIHGGLRYLEHKEFRLVREALAEREILLAKAPHIIRQLRFVMPHRPHLRPAWLIRTGLFLYDHLGHREKLLGSHRVRFDKDSPLKGDIVQGFEYSDCAVDDARLVILNAIYAAERGANILTQSKCVATTRYSDHWSLRIESKGSYQQINAKTLVNATGPWVAEFIEDKMKMIPEYGIRWIQGSHIIVSKLYEGDQAYILQNEDQRVVFAIPYLGEYTLIGTTDREYTEDPNHVEISDQEIDYLLKISNEYFNKQLVKDDIKSTYSGVRPLCDDESNNPSVITRDYTLSLSHEEGQAPLLSIFGGKLTTYRKLAQAVLQQLKPYFLNLPKYDTRDDLLPGAEDLEDVDLLVDHIMQKIEGVSVEDANRWAHAYGTRVWNWLLPSENFDDLGLSFGHGLVEKEVLYLVEQEWAITASDILWRRTKLGLKFDQDHTEYLENYLIQLHVERAKKVA